MDSSPEGQERNSDAVVAVGTEPKRILVVEDDNLNRRLFKNYLTLCGYQVRTMACGCYFFEQIAQFQPDLILLDLKLPSVDGYTLLEQMRTTPQVQHIRVIIVSAFAPRVNKQTGLSLESYPYFMKPVLPSVLSKAIAEELNDN